MATTLRLAGAVAYLTNGSIRDLEGVRQVPRACWATGLAPMHGRIRWLDVGSAVVLGGMTVRPGDLIHADVNGALVLPAGLAEGVSERAAAVHAAEAAFFARMRRPGLPMAEDLASPG
jgi:regulator of RNase E activity RraA